MLCRTARKSILDTRIALPPTFLLPQRARLFNSTSQIIDSPTDALQDAPPAPKVIGVSPTSITPTPTPIQTPPPSRRTPPSAPTTLPPSKPLSDSVQALLPLLQAQPSHFITAHIHAKPYLLTQGDTVRLPFKMPGVNPGDVLRLNRASVIGSRDYTLKGEPYLDERLFECRAVVVGSEGEPVRVKEKTKRRNRRVRTVRTKLKFTVLRIGELRIKGLEEIES